MRPSVSPDGTRILAASVRGGLQRYVLDIDGLNPRRVPNTPESVTFASWSPDGGSIAFQASRDGNFEIYTITVNGTNLQHLTDHPGLDRPKSKTQSGLVSGGQITIGHRLLLTMGPFDDLLLGSSGPEVVGEEQLG